MNNYYLTSQLVADRQAAIAAEVTHRAQLKDAHAARQASAALADRSGSARTRRMLPGRLFSGRLFSGRPAHASA
jgi:hypothetical protein